MRVIVGLTIAFGLFAASFALHIVGGATDQGWLFALAVALIYLTATGFPAIALVASGVGFVRTSQAQLIVVLGGLAGIGFTVAALWAANGRAFAWWEFPLAPLMVLISSGSILLGWRAWIRRGSGARPAGLPANG